MRLVSTEHDAFLRRLSVSAAVMSCLHPAHAVCFIRPCSTPAHGHCTLASPVPLYQVVLDKCLSLVKIGDSRVSIQVVYTHFTKFDNITK